MIYQEEFWRRVGRGDAPDACWEWEGGKSERGYGYCHWKGRHIYAHRLSYYFFHGQLPKGLLVLHKCDNPKCVNPSHLFCGSHADNSADMRSKGRQARGRLIHRAKLNVRAVRAIRRAYAAGRARVTELAAKYRIAKPTVRWVITRKTWKHIP